MPQSELADEFEQARLKAEAREALLRSADPALVTMIGLIAAQTSEGNAETILDELLKKEERLASPDMIQQLRAHFVEDRGFDPGEGSAGDAGRGHRRSGYRGNPRRRDGACGKRRCRPGEACVQNDSLA